MKIPKTRKPRIALIAMGVLGDTKQGSGVPAITELFNTVSKDFDVAFYCLGPVQASHINPLITVRGNLSHKIPLKIRCAILLIRCLIDHLLKPFDLIHSISVFPMGGIATVLGSAINRPVTVHLTSLEAAILPEINYGNLANPKIKKFTEHVFAKATRLIMLTQYQKNIALQAIPLHDRIMIQPLSVNLDRFPYCERTLTYPVKFIHVAYYHPVKDQETLFKAFAMIGQKIDCTLTVIGKWFNNPVVDKLLTELDIKNKVIFCDMINNTELTQYYSSAHIMLHTSLFESECIVVEEAMASGLPVCGTRVGILDDFGDDYAVLVPPKNPVLLFEKTMALINDPSRYLTLQRAARKWMVEHDSSWAAQRYIEIFNQTIVPKH